MLCALHIVFTDTDCYACCVCVCVCVCARARARVCVCMCAQDGPSDDVVHDNVLHYREDHFAQRSHCGKLNRFFLFFIFIAQRSHCGKLNCFYVRVRVSVSVHGRVRIMNIVNSGVFSFSTQTHTPSRYFFQSFNLFSALHKPVCSKHLPDTP
jgi:hypothetical protein